MIHSQYWKSRSVHRNHPRWQGLSRFSAHACLVSVSFALPASLGRGCDPLIEEAPVVANAQLAPFVPLLSDQEAWERLPKLATGQQQSLPSWARAVAVHMPRTAAAMLELDAAHRLRSPLDPALRAKLRWVIAKSNQCQYSEAYALADLRLAGATEADIAQLTTQPTKQVDGRDDGRRDEHADAIEFVRQLTTDAPRIPDELFDRLRSQFGPRGAAAMVLLAAYGNFQDRIILGWNLPLEPGGPLAPLDVRFVEGALQVAPILPPENGQNTYLESAEVTVAADPDWSSVTYKQLQSKLERQRQRKPRLRVPYWDEVKDKLPPVMAASPTGIRWSLVNYGYAHELAIPWTISTRTHWAESPSERILEESLFWVQTRAIECNYCMGHCEMLLEVAGLNKDEIAERTRRLAETDWSTFPPKEQRAYAFARKLSREPWKMSQSDYDALVADWGPKKAMGIYWWLCRGLYMTRISDGFQLPLETSNVFGGLPPSDPKEAKPSK
jgi:alkylhydroperoxidase family enzyme